MPLLKIPTSKKLTATVTLKDTTVAMIDRYAAFSGASADEVVNTACEYIFEKDKDFATWLEKKFKTAPASPLRVKQPAGLAKSTPAYEQATV